MKKHLLILILALPIFVWQSVKGQGYVPLLEGNKQWNVIMYGGHGTGIYTSIYVIAGDTIVNSTAYKIIKSFNYNEEFYIREDSSKKVFQMDLGGIDYLLYDFGVSIGDTVNTYAFRNNQEEIGVVQDIDSVLLMNGEKRKRWKIAYENFNCNDEWIEGIGSIYGVLHPGICYFTWGFSLLCFHENDTLKYTDSLFYIDNCIINEVSITEMSDSKEFIYPNPTNDFININLFNKEILNVEIFNVYGKHVLSTKETININVSSFGKGIYFVKVFYNGGVATSKFLKT